MHATVSSTLKTNITGNKHIHIQQTLIANMLHKMSILSCTYIHMYMCIVHYCLYKRDKTNILALLGK